MHRVTPFVDQHAETVVVRVIWQAHEIIVHARGSHAAHARQIVVFSPVARAGHFAFIVTAVFRGEKRQ